jgi:hypothetical protein
MVKSFLEELENNPRNLPLPEHVINAIEGATIAYVDTVFGQRLYCVRDWVYFVSRSKAANRSGPWSDLKKVIETEGSFKVSENLRVLEIDTSGGKQRMDFTDEEGLYQITQRMSDRSKNVRDIKTYLAKSGVYMGEAYRNPGAAADELYNREYDKLIAEGFSPEEAQQWLDVRRKQKQQRLAIVAIWKDRGINRPTDYADLTNQIHRVALGRTATRHKRELAVKDTPRNYISAADNATIQVTELTSGLLHIHRESYGKPELSEDIDDVRPIIDAARPEIQNVFSKKPRRLPAANRPPNLDR